MSEHEPPGPYIAEKQAHLVAILPLIDAWMHENRAHGQTAAPSRVPWRAQARGLRRTSTHIFLQISKEFR